MFSGSKHTKSKLQNISLKFVNLQTKVFSTRFPHSLNICYCQTNPTMHEQHNELHKQIIIYYYISFWHG